MENKVLEYLKQGDLVYELYAVLVHSGSAIGGHYYAYIKSFEDGKWYNYNDSNVSEI
jgi:ubiquitin carboxyl-terminal hydrolase 47